MRLTRSKAGKQVAKENSKDDRGEPPKRPKLPIKQKEKSKDDGGVPPKRPKLPIKQKENSKDDGGEPPKRPKLPIKQQEKPAGHEDGFGAQVASNALILDQIFKHLPPNFSNLQSFRQVSKIWYYKTLQQWRELAVVRLCSGKSLEHALKACTFSDYSDRMRNPNDKFYQLDQYPYRNYHLISFHFPECKLFCANMAKEKAKFKKEYKLFWEKAGHLVTHLELDSCIFSPNQQELFEKLITEKLSNLQSLVLTNTRVQDSGCLMVDNHLSLGSDAATAALYQNRSRNTNLKRIKIGGQLPMGIAILLLSAPSIDVLEFGPDFDKGNKDIFYFHIAMRNASIYRNVVDCQPFQVKTLDIMDINFNKNPTHISVSGFLRSTGYPLETLKLMLSNSSSTKTEDIQNMLIPTVQLFRNSLKHLTVFRPPVYKFAGEDPFPVEMESLEELYLYGNIVENLNFLQNMPALKTLLIDYKCHGQDGRIKEMFSTTSDDSDQKDCRTLYHPYKESGSFGNPSGGDQNVKENLERLHLNLLPHETLFSSLKKQTPNLKTLEIVLRTKEFQLVCKELPSLEELVLLHGSRLDDETFTGIVHTTEYRNPNNITRMKSLKTFEIKSACFEWDELYDVNTRLGDKAVYKGFMEISTLQKVVVCASSQMTEEAENALKQHVLLARIVRNYKGTKHENSDCCKLKSFLEFVGAPC